MSDVTHGVEQEDAFNAQPAPAVRPQPPSGAGSPGASGFPTGGMPDMDPAQMRHMLSMLRDNPGMMQHVHSTLGAMTPEQLQAAVRPAAGSIRCCMTHRKAVRAERMLEAASSASSRLCRPSVQARMNGADPLPGMDMSPEMLRTMVGSLANMGPSEVKSMMATMEAARAAAPASTGSVSAAPAGMPMPPMAGSQQFQQAAAAVQVKPGHTFCMGCHAIDDRTAEQLTAGPRPPT